MKQTIAQDKRPDDDTSLLTAISDDTPCGISIDDDPQFLLLLAGLQPKADAQYGDFYEPAETINWSETAAAARRLLCRSKDIRLIIILMRCQLRLTGAAALRSGLSLLLALLHQWPDELHPQLLDEDEFVPQLRANAFAELNDSFGILADIRQLRLPKTTEGQLNVRDVERCSGSQPADKAFSAQRLALMRQQWTCSEDATFRDLARAQQHAPLLVSQIQQNLGDDAPDLNAFLSLLNLFTPEAPLLPEVPAAPVPSAGSPVRPELPARPGPVPPPTLASALPAIRDRQSACARLEEVRLWFSEAEPGSPVIPLLAYAGQSIGRNFSELVAMYPPEILTLLKDK